MPVLTPLLVTLRTFRRTPVFTGLIVATLAVGIGATTLVSASPTGWYCTRFRSRTGWSVSAQPIRR